MLGKGQFDESCTFGPSVPFAGWGMLTVHRDSLTCKATVNTDRGRMAGSRGNCECCTGLTRGHSLVAVRSCHRRLLCPNFRSSWTPGHWVAGQGRLRAQL